ncbi:MAG: helix-turn-helix domain-containing protein [bacterium]
MDIEQTLRQFGLNAKEIKVYLALLQLGRASVLAIAKKADIKRPTTYLILEDLMVKGLIAKIPRKNKTLFIAENPKKLLQISERRKDQISRIIPNLLGLYNTKEDKPQIQLYEGRAGVEQAYDLMIQAKDVWYFGNLSTVYQDFRDIYDKVEVLLKSKKMALRDFLGDSDWEREYAAQNQNINHEIRISNLPVEMDLALFEDKTAIISLKENLYAVIIQDQRIVNSLKGLYQLAWVKAGKLKPDYGIIKKN